MSDTPRMVTSHLFSTGHLRTRMSVAKTNGVVDVQRVATSVR